MRYLVGMLLGLAMAGVPVYAYRMEKPQTFIEWNSNNFTVLNNVLLQLWNISNGRYQSDVVTVDPDGARRGNVGEAVLFDTGTDQWCVNVDGATTWKCVNLT